MTEVADLIKHRIENTDSAKLVKTLKENLINNEKELLLSILNKEKSETTKVLNILLTDLIIEDKCPNDIKYTTKSEFSKNSDIYKMYKRINVIDEIIKEIEGCDFNGSMPETME